ncbi:MAG: glycosyltransferase [Ignavibacteriaceae bacterium]|jgi:glycosyltransferase involved in cell wall biosynthesis
MKVIFLLNGLTHYVIPVLNKLNSTEGLDIVCIAQSDEANNVGQGVFLTQKGIEFRVHFLKEKRRFYGKTFFKGTESVIRKEAPHVIVLGWPYILELVFNPLLLLKIKKRGIRIVFKEIPFQVQSFSDALRFKPTNFIDEDLTIRKENFYEKIKNLFLAILRRYYYAFVDINVNYIEDSYELLKSFGVKKEHIFVAYNSPATDSLFKAKINAEILGPILPNNKQRIIHVGRLVKWKRVDLLIHAVKDLQSKFPNIELIVIGDGPEMNQLKLTVESLELSHRIYFVGSIYDPVILGRYFLSSSIYILAGMGGLSINEAMLYGKPIICSVCDGTEKKIVRNGFNGFIFSAGDLMDLKEKISLLLSDDDKIKNYGNNSLSIIEKEVNVYTVIKGYIDAFNYLATN